MHALSQLVANSLPSGKVFPYTKCDAPALQFHKKAMLSGPTLVLRPIWALEFGGITEGLIFEWLRHRAITSGLQHEGSQAVRLSYASLQQRLPFVTRRWIIEIIKRLRSIGAIHVVNTTRVNVIVPSDEYEMKTASTPQNNSAMLVFPELACKVGLKEAMALQQIHLRHYFADGSHWAIRPLSRWQSDSFMFLSIATVRRLFTRLRERGLVFVQSYDGEAGPVNCYRVNYVKVAEILGLPSPTFKVPEGEDAEGWVDPFYPIKAIEVAHSL